MPAISSIFKPQALSMAGPAPCTSLPPVKGASYEAGLKGELMDGRLNATFSLFNVERTGTAVVDPRYETSNSRWSGNCCYLHRARSPAGASTWSWAASCSPLAAGSGLHLQQHPRPQHRKYYSSITPRHLFSCPRPIRCRASCRAGKWAAAPRSRARTTSAARRCRGGHVRAL